MRLTLGLGLGAVGLVWGYTGGRSGALLAAIGGLGGLWLALGGWRTLTQVLRTLPRSVSFLLYWPIVLNQGPEGCDQADKAGAACQEG